MQKLKANEIIYITESVLRALAQNRITTVLEFLQEDVVRLSNITKLNLPQVLDVRKELFEKYSAPSKNGVTLLVKKLKHLRTGVPNLDLMLEGGLPAGCMTELCGLADSGKTQLCFQLVINCAKNDANAVLYIDTKGDFSAVRIQKILDASGFTHKEMAEIMYRIKVIRVWTLEEAIDLLRGLKNKVILVEDISLIIIDSLTCLMLQFLGDDSKIGLSMLNTLVNYSRYLCKELEITMIYVNIQTRWVDQDVADLDSNEDASSYMKDTFVERRNRCLGKYWQYIPSLVLLLEKIQSNNCDKNSEKLGVSVMQSNKLSIKSGQRIIIHLSDAGVT